MGSIPEKIISKLDEAQALALKQCDFSAARSLEIAVLELTARLAEGGNERAGYALTSSKAQFLSLSTNDAFSVGEQDGYAQAVAIIESMVETYDLFAGMPQSYFERHSAWKDLSKSEHPRAIPVPIGEIVVFPVEEDAGAPLAAADSADEADSDYSVGELLQSAEDELLAWVSGNRSSTNAQLNAEVSPEDRGETLVRIAQQDAAELELATRKVEALRLLLAGQPTS